MVSDKKDPSLCVEDKCPELRVKSSNYCKHHNPLLAILKVQTVMEMSTFGLPAFERKDFEGE